MSTRKIDGRKAEITNKMKEYTTYRAFAVKHGYPDAAVISDYDDPRKQLQNGDVVTLLTSCTNEYDDRYTVWIVEAANGERHLIGEEGLRILDEDHALNDEIAVLPDESLGGVLREYREVKRKAKTSERVRVFGHILTEGNGVFVVDHASPAGEIRYTVNGDSAYGTPYYDGRAYAVLEPTDIVYVDGPDGVSRKYRMVDRKAAVGERVIMTAATGTRFNGHSFVPDYHNGDIFVIERLGHGDLAVSTAGKLFYHCEYRVLEPVEPADPTPASLSTRPATDQIAENIANLTAKVTELETRLNALYDWHKRAAVDIRVAHEDIVLVEEGVSDAIKSLESRVSALEDSARPCVKVASGPVDKTPPSFITLKTLQQIRDEIVERAKADVKALSVSMVRNVPVLRGGTAVFNLEHGDNAPTFPDIVKFKVDRGKRTVVALIYTSTGTLWARGIAKCAPGDVFNAHIGRAIALRRALGLEVPTEYLNAPNPTEVRVGDVVKATGASAYLPGTSGPVVAMEGSGLLYRNPHGTRGDGTIWALPHNVTIIDDTREDGAPPAQKGAAA